MTNLRRRSLLTATLLLLGAAIEAFAPTGTTTRRTTTPTFIHVASSSSTALSAEPATATTQTSFIQTELRGAAMKLHTRAQAPREGQQEEDPKKEPYTPTHRDYLAFLVDSQHVYEAMEEIVNERPELAVFRNTGLERTKPLEEDICFLVAEYKLERPPVGPAGREYAAQLRQMESIPEFVCHYYNHYFAHTAGGRMIGKSMSKLLLDGKTLEFYKWDGDLNQLKDTVKDQIETMAASWNADEKKECVDATAAAFRGGGRINGYLSGSAAAESQS